MDINTAKKELALWQRKLSAYYHAMGAIQYDGATVAPKDTADNRAVSLGILSEECYKLSTGEATVAMLEFLDANKESLSDAERRIVYLALKDIRELQKIPMNEYIEYRELLVMSEDVWHRAKENDDVASFLPYLEKIFDTERRFALYCAPDKAPYDYCLNKYEDGLDMARCDEFFAALRGSIVPLIEEIKSLPAPSTDILKGDFPVALQKELSLYLMDLLCIDKGRCGIGETEHPFTTSLGSHKDVRITTNYDEGDFSSSMFSVIHEGGHALYDLNSAPEYAYTLLDGGVSMGIHESQSRFYENLIGRSKPFIELVFPKIQELFSLEGHTADELYRAVNAAMPSFIRTEADEVTYCLHVMVRYEIEKRVMANELAVADIPAEWKRLYKEYLGVDVPNDREGMLQDSHWSGGAIGYFPSYALGTAYSAQLFAKMKESVPVDECIAKGDLSPLNEWNREHIWRYGSLKTPKELLSNALGAEFDPRYFVEYLSEKYKKLYGAE